MQRLIILTSVLFALAACQSVVETSNSVILAPKDTSKPHAVIIALNGALCDPHSYISFFQTVQASSSYSLWVAFPKFFFDMPFFVGGAISSTLNDLKTLKANTSLVFVAGHSLGGVTGQDYTNGNSAGIKGLILLGSYMQMKYEDPQVNFPVPVLTLSGELDGLSKLARLAISFNQMLRHPEQKGHLRYPVAIVPGATHSSFINGSVPGPVKNSDLKPEISNEEAWKTFARIINAFIDVQLNSSARKSSEKVLSDYVYGVSFPLVQPLLQAMTLEGNPHLSNQSIVGNTTWATDNVYYEMNLSSKAFKTQISMQEHGLIQFALDKPSVSFENNVLKHQIYVYKTYSWLQFFDVSQISYESADYIAVKYKGSDAIYRAANLSGTPGQITCRDLNQKAIYQVLATLPEATVERYQKYGVKLVLGDDNVCSTGSSWLSTSLGFDDKGDYVVVSSPRLSTAVDSSIFPGMFYCKLFSPARIAEWIYTDSLRKNYNIKA